MNSKSGRKTQRCSDMRLGVYPCAQLECRQAGLENWKPSKAVVTVRAPAPKRAESGNRATVRHDVGQLARGASVVYLACSAELWMAWPPFDMSSPAPATVLQPARRAVPAIRSQAMSRVMLPPSRGSWCRRRCRHKISIGVVRGLIGTTARKHACITYCK